MELIVYCLDNPSYKHSWWKKEIQLRGHDAYVQCAGFHAMRGYLEIVNTEGVDPELVKRCQMVVDGSRQPNWFSSMDEAERVYQLGLGPSKSARG